MESKSIELRECRDVYGSFMNDIVHLSQQIGGRKSPLCKLPDGEEPNFGILHSLLHSNRDYAIAAVNESRDFEMFWGREGSPLEYDESVFGISKPMLKQIICDYLSGQIYTEAIIAKYRQLLESRDSSSDLSEPVNNLRSRFSSSVGLIYGSIVPPEQPVEERANYDMPFLYSRFRILDFDGTVLEFIESVTNLNDLLFSIRNNGRTRGLEYDKLLTYDKLYTMLKKDGYLPKDDPSIKAIITGTVESLLDEELRKLKIPHLENVRLAMSLVEFIREKIRLRNWNKRGDIERAFYYCIRAGLEVIVRSRTDIQEHFKATGQLPSDLKLPENVALIFLAILNNDEVEAFSLLAPAYKIKPRFNLAEEVSRIISEFTPEELEEHLRRIREL